MIYADVLNPGKYKIMEEYTKEGEPFLWFGDGYNMEILAELIKNDKDLQKHLDAHFALNIERNNQNINTILNQLSSYYNRNLHVKRAAKDLMRLMGVVTFKYDDGKIRTVQDQSYIKNFNKYLDSFRDLILASLTSTDNREEATQKTAELIFEAIKGFEEYDRLKQNPTQEEATTIIARLDLILNKILSNYFSGEGHNVEISDVSMKLDDMWENPPVDELATVRSYFPELKNDIQSEKELLEPQLYALRLMQIDKNQKIKTIKLVRSLSDLGLKEAKDAVENKSFVKSKLTKDEAEEIKTQFENMGATVTIEPPLE